MKPLIVFSILVIIYGGYSIITGRIPYARKHLMILKSLYYLLERSGEPGNSGHLLFYIWIYQASRMDGNCCSSGTLFYKFYITENLRYKMRI